MLLLLMTIRCKYVCIMGDKYGMIPLMYPTGHRAGLAC